MASKLIGTLTLDEGSLASRHFSNASGDELDADVQEHLYKAITNFGVDRDATPTSQTKLVFVASTAGTIRGFYCGLYDTGTSTSVAYDLRVNGTTVLSATVTVAHTDSDREIKSGTISSATLAADDWVEIDLAVTSSTGAVGPIAWAEIQELAQ